MQCVWERINMQIFMRIILICIMKIIQKKIKKKKPLLTIPKSDNRQ